MSKIISIHSFRGGTGKSNTTANVAANNLKEMVTPAITGKFGFVSKQPCRSCRQIWMF